MNLKSDHAWHIQNLIEVEPDCQVVELRVAEELQQKLEAVVDHDEFERVLESHYNISWDNLELQYKLEEVEAKLATVGYDAVMGLLDTDYTCETPNGDNAWGSYAIEKYANKLKG